MTAVATAARLTVHRNSKKDIGERHLVVPPDAKNSATCWFRQSLIREIEAGHHGLKLHNTLVWKAVDFDAAPGEHVRFLACNKLASGSFSLLLMIGVGPLSVTVERLSDPASP
jgi:hypothetical protein